MRFDKLSDKPAADSDLWLSVLEQLEAALLNLATEGGLVGTDMLHRPFGLAEDHLGGVAMEVDDDHAAAFSHGGRERAHGAPRILEAAGSARAEHESRQKRESLSLSPRTWAPMRSETTSAHW